MHPIENLRYVARARGVPAVDLVRETAHALSWLGATGPDLVIACRRIVERQPDVGQLWWLMASILAAPDVANLDELIDELVDAIETDPTARHLAAALPNESTVVTIGRPETISDALVRRGDVRVLCADSQHEASSFLRRLELAGVECEPLPSEYLARAIAGADLVLIEASAMSESLVVAPVGSHVLAAVAADAQRPIWIAAPIGTRLPQQYVDVIAGDRVNTNDSQQYRQPTYRESDTDVFVPRLATHLAVGEGVVALDRLESWAADCRFIPELMVRSAS